MTTKNLWRRKCISREIFRTVEVRVLFAAQPLHRGVTRRGSFNTKNEKNFFYHKLDLNIFLFDNFFEKKTSIFRENYEKLFWGPFDHFSGKEGFCPKS